MTMLTSFCRAIGFCAPAPAKSDLALEDRIYLEDARWVSSQTPTSESELAFEDQVLVDAAVWANRGGAPLD